METAYHVITYEAVSHLDLTTIIEGDITLNNWTPINVSICFDNLTKKFVACVLYSFETTPTA